MSKFDKFENTTKWFRRKLQRFRFRRQNQSKPQKEYDYNNQESQKTQFVGLKNKEKDA